MKSSKLVVLLLWFVSANLLASDLKASFDSANAAYAKGDFDAAIKGYEQIVAQNQVSANLYFNLGNAYFKTNAIGLAILNYERAKKLNPEDEDINANLKLANLKTEDKIEAAPQLFLSQWKKGIVGFLSEKEWSVALLVFLTLGLMLIAIYIVSAKRSFKQIGFFGGLFFLFSAFFLFFIARSSYDSAVNSASAIITSSSVTVNGSPSDKGTKLFILHEGLKVEITDEQDEWTEIKISNGNVGWLKSKDLIKI